MGVFLRWGVFGIVAVAALIYAYNANKNLAERRGTPAAAPSGYEDEEDQSTSEQAEPGQPSMPEHCQAEFRVAQRALEASAAGEPLDRVLRHQAITFEEDPARRQQLEKVANRWYAYDGEEMSPAALRRAVLVDCRLSPAP